MAPGVLRHCILALALVCCLAPWTALGQGIIITPTSLSLDETGAAKTYSLQLQDACNIDPCAATLLPSQIGGDTERFTFSPDIIRWKAANWNTVVDVTVTPINNDIDDALGVFKVQHNVLSQQADKLFEGVLNVDITNDDVAKLVVTQPAGLVATEGSSSATVTVKLNSEPLQDVVVTTTATGSELGVSPSTRTFTNVNWNADQSFSLTVTNDAAAAATRVTTRLIRVTSASTDPKYQRVSEVQSVTLTGSTAVGGTVTLSYDGYVTAAIPVTSGGSSVAAALSALDNVYSVTVSAAANGANGYTWLVTFAENSGDLPLLLVNTNSMSGAGASGAVAQVTAGVPPYTPEFSGEFELKVIDDDLKVTITSITAADTGNQPGPGNGDSMTLVFSEDTNRPAVGNKAAVDALFTFSTTIGLTYSGEWILEDVPGASTMSATSGSADVTANADLTSALVAGDELVLSGVAYTVLSVAITGGTAQAPTSTVTLTSVYLAATGTVAAQHRSRSRLRITLTDVTGMNSLPDMRVGTLSITLKSAAQGSSLSDRYDASAAASSNTVVALGTWGAMSPPQVSSATATPTGNQAGIGALDRLVVTFDSATDRAGFGSNNLNTDQVNALFKFTADGNVVSLGTTYSGSWESDTTFRITLLDLTGAASQRLTRVGKLLVSARAGNSVLSFDETSTQATNSATLGGDWGAQTAPAMSSLVAADAVTPYSPSPGISRGDTVTITFDSPTSMPAAATRADILTWLSFSANLGNAYTGAWTNDGATLKITLTDMAGTADAALTAVGTLTATVTALLKSADESSTVSGASSTLGGTWGKRSAPAITSAVASDPGSLVSGLSPQDELLITFDVPTNQPSIINVADLLTFEAPGVAGSVWDVSSTAQVTGSWDDATHFRVVVVSNTGVNFANTRVGFMAATVKASGGLKTLDGSSDASTSSQTISGTWGAHTAVAITTATASAEGGQAGLGDGDRLTVVFDKDTNRASGHVEASVVALFTFSASIGSTLSGTWSSRTTLVITVTDSAGAGAVADTRVGALTVTVKSGGDLRTADESSPVSTATSGVGGTWGDYPPPAITSAVAMDPVSSLASAGFSNNDILRLTFDIPTNRAVASSMTKTQVDSLLSFTNGGAVSLGADYTGAWTSSTVLDITLVDTTGADVAKTTIGALRVTVYAAAQLLSEDLSSNPSISSGLVTGTWGDFPAPQIVSATAADGGNQAGLGIGDTLTLVFDQSTNRAGATGAISQSQVDALLSFSARLGVAYTGQWTATDTLVLTVTTPDATVPSQNTAVGRLYVKVKSAANLKSVDESSSASTSVGYVNLGTWGARAAPTVVSVDGADTGNNEGLGNGDSIRFTFSAATSQVGDGEVQSVRSYASSGSTVGGTFTLAFHGESTGDIPRTASASDMRTALTSLPSVGDGGVVVTRSATADATGGYTWSVTFTSTARYGVGDVGPLVADTAKLTGSGATIDVAEVKKGTLVTGAKLAQLITLSASVGSATTGQWSSDTILEVSITDTSGAQIFESRIPNIRASVLAAGGLKSADGSSPAIAESLVLLGGTWGVHSAPVISTALAADATPLQEGIGAGDTLTISFNKATNQPAQTGSGKAGVQSLFTFSSELGAAYSGAWISGSQFVVTISDATGADTALTRVGLLSVTVAGSIVTTDLSSSPASGTRTVTGSWGDHSKPAIVSAQAADPGSVIKGISDGDVVDITFNKETNQPSGTVAELFGFTSGLGPTQTGTWTSTTVYQVTLADASGADPASTRVGLLKVAAQAAANIKSRDQSSPAADNDVTLSGTWGDHDAPALVSATAADTGNQPGVGIGDTLTLLFDIDVNRVANFAEPVVTAIMVPSASIGSGLTGRWTNTRTLVITITNDAGKGTVLQTQVGVMSVAIQAAANLVSADYSSPVSTATITVSGDWGVFPAPEIVSAVASDPVSSPATAGLTPNDKLTLTFNMDTNTPAAATVTDLNNLLSFTAVMGTNYTGVWETSRRLVIEFHNTGGSNVVDTRVNHLQVSVKAAAQLRSSDGSSVDSSDTATVTGSWGPFAKPTITSMTAADGAPAQEGIGDGDTLTVEFSQATNQPALATAAAVNALFNFNAPIGMAMAGAWQAANRVVITITTVHPDAATTNAADTAVGSLYATLSPSAGLRSADDSSPAADGYGLVDAGTWGARTAPVVAAAVASDTAPNEGIGVGDTLTVNFNSPTSMVAAAAVQTVTSNALATVGGTFTLAYKGRTTAAIAHDATGAAVAAALGALPTVGTGGAVVTRAVADAGVGTYVWTVTFQSACRLCAGSVPALVPVSSLTGAGGSVAVAVTSAGNLLNKAGVDALLSYSASLGADYTGEWKSSSSLAVLLVDLTGAGPVLDTVPGTLTVGVRVTGGLVSADGSSSAVAGTPTTLSGTWGKHSAPTIVKAEASDGGNQAGLNVADRITVWFNKPTNKPNAFASLVTISPNDLGRTLTYLWLGDQLIISVGAVSGAPVHVSTTRIGLVGFALEAAGNLRSADLTSDPSTDTAIVTGTWGDHPAPRIISAVASDGSGTPGIAAGDVITVGFDQVCNRPGVGSVAALSAVLTLSASLGTLSTQWADDSNLRMTIVAPTPGDETPAVTRVGLLNLAMTSGNPLRSADLSSPEGIGSAVLSGTWGKQPAPVLVTAEAFDDGGAAGLNTGDTLLLTFDKATNRAPDATADLLNLLRFSATVGPVSGNWENRRQLRVTFLDTSARSPPQDVVAGVMNVTVLAPGGLRSADESSDNSTGVAVISGSFGVYPTPTLVSVVASNTGNNEGIGVGDSYLFLFNVETEAPTSAITLGNLVSFSADVGAMTFAWVDAKRLRVTLSDLSTADPPHLTRIGLIEAVVKSGGGSSLRSADRSSAEVDTAMKATGTYGPHSPPVMSVFAAANTGNAAGENAGDTITITFNKTTNAPYLGRSAGGLVAEKDAVDQVFAFAAKLGTWYRGTWNTVPIANGVATVRHGSTLVVTPASVQGSLVMVGSRIRVGDFDDYVASFVNSTAFHLRNKYSGPTSKTASIYGESRITALLTVTDSTGADPFKTRVGGLRMAVRQHAQLRSSDLTSEPSIGERTLGGSWGPHPAPVVTAVQASDQSQEPGTGFGASNLSPGDTLLLHFDQATNTPPVATKDQVDAAVNFSAPLGTNYVGTWLTTQLPGYTVPEVGASVLRVSHDLRPHLSRGDQFRVGFTVLQVATTGTFSATTVPLAWPVPASLLALTPPARRLSSPGGHQAAGDPAVAARRLATEAELASRRSLYAKSTTTLMITVLDPAGAGIPSLVAPGALVVGVHSVKSADESSPEVDDKEVVTGSWNPAPIIVSATANHGAFDRISYGLDKDDFLLVVFNIETNTPHLGNKSSVDALFSVTAPLGADYTGGWLNPSVAQIRIVNATGAGTAAQLRAGTLVVQVRKEAGLVARVGNSGLSNSFRAVVGLWGSELPPELKLVTAINGNSAVGVASGDVIQVEFDRDTNMPAVEPTPEVQVVTLSSVAVQEVQTVAMTGAGITGFFSLTLTLPGATEPVGTELIATTAVATKAEEVEGAFGRGIGESMEAKLEAVAGVGLVTVSTSVNGATGAPQWTITFDTIEGSISLMKLNETQLSFAHGASNLGAGVEVLRIRQGQTLGGSLTFSMGTADQSGVIQATASSGDIVTALAQLPMLDGASVEVLSIGSGGSVSWTIAFTHNVGDLPTLSVATNSLTGSVPTVAVVTQVTGVTSQGQVNTLFHTSSALPQAISASWLNPRVLQMVLHDISITDPEAADLASLRVAVRTDTQVIRSAGGTVPAFGGGTILASAGGIGIGGSFGPRAAPAMASVAAVDGSGSAGLESGDRLVITFDVDTNRPPVATADEVDALLWMSAAIGCDYTGAWTSLRVLTITVADSTCADRKATAVGTLRLVVRGATGHLRTADLTSPDSTAAAILSSGTWGDQPVPEVASATAADSSANPVIGISDGDTVTLEFNTPTSAPRAGSKAAVDALLTFTESIGANYTGAWAWETAVGRAALTADRSHLILGRAADARLLGPGTSLLLGADVASATPAWVAGSPSVWSLGAATQLTGAQLGNPATMQRLMRSNSHTTVPLSAAVPAGVGGCTAEEVCVVDVWSRSRMRLVVTVTDSTDAAPSGTALSVTVRGTEAGATAIRSEDSSSAAVTGTSPLIGDFGSLAILELHEQWWFWLLVFLLLLLCCCCILMWFWFKRNYIFCFKDNKMGRTAFTAAEPTQLYSSVPATLGGASTRDAAAIDDEDVNRGTLVRSSAAYRGLSGGGTNAPAQTRLTGFSRTSASKVRKGRKRMPTVAPGVIIHAGAADIFNAPAAAPPPLPPNRLSGNPVSDTGSDRDSRRPRRGRNRREADDGAPGSARSSRGRRHRRRRREEAESHGDDY